MNVLDDLMIKGIVFDMDGVIIDSEKVYENVIQEFFRRRGMKIKDEDLSKVKGMTFEKEVGYLNENYNLDLKLHDYRNAITEMVLRLAKEIRLFPKALDILNSLRDGFSLALTTSSSSVFLEAWNKRHDFIKYFDVVVTGDEIENSKPHPEPYSITFERLGLKPEECVVIEDSVNGIKSAKAAGAKVIAISSNFSKEKLEEADIVVGKLIEIQDALGEVVK